MKADDHPLRVLLVSLHFAEYSTRLARAMASHAQVTLVLYQDNALAELGETGIQQCRAQGYRLVLLHRPRGIASLLLNVRSLLRLSNAGRADVVHVQEAMRDELAIAFPLMRVRVKVLTVHDPEKHAGAEARLFRFSRHRIYRFVLRQTAQRAITHGAALVSALAAACPRLEGQIWSVPHGPLGPEAPLSKTPLPAGQEAQLLFFGRVQAYKGLGHFIAAVLAMRAAGVAVRGVIAGRGPDIALHAHALSDREAFDLHDRFIPVPEVHELFRQARAVVLPYIEGTQSGVAALALGYGRPLVATAVGSIPELAKDGVNALLVPPQDHDALVAALTRIVQDDSLHDRLSAGAVALLQGKLSWDEIAASTLQAYRPGARPATVLA